MKRSALDTWIELLDNARELRNLHSTPAVTSALSLLTFTEPGLLSWLADTLDQSERQPEHDANQRSLFDGHPEILAPLRDRRM